MSSGKILDSQKLAPASEITCLRGTSSGNDLQKDEKSISDWPSCTPWTALCNETNEFGTATWQTQRLRWETTQPVTETLKTMLQRLWDVNINEYVRSRIRTHPVFRYDIHFLSLIVVLNHTVQPQHKFCVASSWFAYIHVFTHGTCQCSQIHLSTLQLWIYYMYTSTHFDVATAH